MNEFSVDALAYFVVGVYLFVLFGVPTYFGYKSIMKVMGWNVNEGKENGK